MRRFPILTVTFVTITAGLMGACGDPGDGGSSSSNGSTLPSCTTSKPFTVAPLKPSDYAFLLPIGGMTTPAHLFPSDHGGFALLVDPNNPTLTKSTTVVAPGNVHLDHISGTVHFDQNDNAQYTDYSFTLSPCAEISLSLGHLQTLAPKLAQAISSWDNCTDDTHGGVQHFRYCNKSVSIDLVAGETIGTSGGVLGQPSLDMGAVDTRTPALGFVNPSRFDGNQLHTVCPTDLFTDAPRLQMEATMGGVITNGTVTHRTAAPICGQFMQDAPGTAQGDWYKSDVTSNDDYSKQMALVHHFIDPSMVTVTSGGGPLGSYVISLPPQPSGLINRDPQHITADGKVYCYDLGFNKDANPPGTQRLLVQLTSATTLNAELQSGACAAGVAFTSAMIQYIR